MENFTQRIKLLLWLMLLSTSIIFSQEEINGPVNNTVKIISVTDPNCGDCDSREDCWYRIEVEDASAFSADDRVLIVQMKGASIDVSNTASGGQITDIGNAGNYEFFLVGKVDYANNYIYPRGELKRTYDYDGLMQLIKVPTYTGDVEINSDLIGEAWNPATGRGGVIAIFVDGTLTFNANIDVSGRGYQGVTVSVNGSPDNCSVNPSTQMVWPSANADVSPKGQGIVVDDPLYNGGRAPRANGGGGGVSGDSGGGGGSNYGAGGAGGDRWCDNGAAPAGGLGGVEMTSYIAQNRIFFGGAGGAGFVTSGNSASAAHGGGLIVIKAKKIIGNGHSILASGSSPSAAGTGIDGGGGGGGGGTVAFEIQEFEGSLTVDVSGGDGQDLGTAVLHGPGGGGGGGAFLHNLPILPSGIIVEANGGEGGIHNGGARNNSVDGSAGGVVSYFNLVYSDEDSDEDNISDYCDLDTDNDGLLDSDEDGNTGFDPSKDADADGIPNYKDNDDSTPGFPAMVDTNSDGINDLYDRDKDGIADFLDLDSDNDGIMDATEAGGVADASGALSNYTDTDIDGLNDSVDPDNGGTPLTKPDYDGDGAPDFLDLDSDNDGVSDAYESSASTIATGVDDDNDGIDNIFDVDQGGVFNTVIDRDGDTIDDMFDIDSDNDGITDYYETSGIAPSGSDSDADGIDDTFDLDQTGGADVDGDWIDDKSLPLDSDSDMLYDIHDLDADADGIVDNIEAQSTSGYVAPLGIDTDTDGLDNAYDDDNGGTIIIPSNIDGDDKPDFIDTNSDEDSKSDIVEAHDFNRDGVSDILPLGTDTDNDGIDDIFDSIVGNDPADGGELPTDYPDVDDPGNDRDWRENLPGVVLSVDRALLAENVQVATITLTLSETSYQPVTIPLTYTGSATNVDDYNRAVLSNAPDVNSVVIPAGQLVGEITITTVDDSVDEQPETVIVTAGVVTGGKIIGDDNRTITIVDNDAAGYTVSAISNSIDESGTTATFSVVLNSVPTADVVLDLALSVDDLTEANIDALGNELTFEVGNWNVAQVVTVTGQDDVIIDGDQTFDIVISIKSTTDVNYNVLGAQTISGTNIDDDEAPVANDDTDLVANETNEDVPFIINVLSNDTDDKDALNLASVDLDQVTGGVQNSITNAYGTWNVSNIGVVTFTPLLNSSGVATINYTVADTDGLVSNEATLSVNVVAINDAPVAVNDLNNSTNEDTSLNDIVIADNDTDVDGSVQASTIILIDPGNVTNTGNSSTPLIIAGVGVYSVDASGNVDFVPALNYNGPANVNYTIDDDMGATSNVATVFITVDSQNDEPTAVDDTGNSTNEDNPITVVTINSNDTDVDGNVVATSIVLIDPSDAGNTANSGADLVISGVGTYRADVIGNVSFTPVANYNGAANVNYTILDNSGAISNVATVYINVVAQNDAPVVTNPVNVITAEDTPYTFTGAFLISVADVDGDDQTVTVTVTNGVASLSQITNLAFTTGDGDADATMVFSGTLGDINAALNNIVYTPTADYDGLASLSINTSDGTASDDGAVSITVTPGNDAPVAVNDLNNSVDEDNPITINFIASNDTDVDGSVLASTIVLIDPSNGTNTGNSSTPLVISGVGTYTINALGNLTFTPVQDFNGSANVFYTIDDDGGLTSNVATVQITVDPVNDAPVAVNDVLIADEDNDATVNVTTNDTDVDGTVDVTTVDLDPSTGGIQTTFASTNGDWSVDNTGLVTFTPDANWFGDEVINYTVNDNDGTVSNSATITATINDINDAPVAVNDVLSADEDNAATVNVTTNDTDVDGTVDVTTVDLDPSTGGIQTTFASTNGDWSVDNTGLVTFTPDANWFGVEVINYTVNDNNGTVSNSATITATINDINDAPVAVNDVLSADEDNIATVNVTTNDTDVDGTVDVTTVDLDPSTGGIQTTFASSNGDWSVDNTGLVTFTPDANWFGDEVINYTVNDNNGTVSNSATITATINDINDAPVAVNDVLSADEDNNATVNVTTNDTDADGTIVVSTVDLDPSTGGIQTTFASTNGDWSVDNTGLVTFTPDANWFGVEVINYTVNDNDGTPSNSATITATINDINDAPVAVNDVLSADEDNVATVNVTTNDTDVDGTVDLTTVDLDPSTGGIQTTFASSNGDWSVDNTGLVTFTPDANWFGDEIINYTVNDNDGTVSNSATITATINDINDAPVAVNDVLSADEDNAATVNVTTNDTDVDGTVDVTTVDLDPSTGGIQTTFASTNGDWSVDNTGLVTFTPDANWFGVEVINYTVNDNDGTGSNSATITATINTINDVPVAQDDVYSVAQGQTININAASGVLDNDSDIENDPITAILVDDVSNGTLTLNADGSFDYSHDGTVTYTDSFTYKVNDGTEDGNTVTVTINILGVNNIPVGNNDVYSVSEGGTLTIDATSGVLDNDTDGDGDALNAIFVGDVSNGTLTLNADGSFIYTHDGSETTSDSFTYRPNDSKQTGNLTTVTITVTPVNDTPVAVSDVASVDEDGVLNGTTVLGNDSDPEGDDLTVNTTPVTDVTNGTLVINPDGSYTYTPDADFNGTDSFEYEVCDDGTPSACARATVTITVNAVNDAPVAVNDVASVDEDGVLNGTTVLANDSDPEGDNLTINTTPVTDVTNGTLVINPDGSYTYTPDAGFSGNDSFEYEVCDDGTPSLCTKATVSITVNSDNDSPVAVSDVASVDEDGVLNGTTVLENDSDPEGDNLTVNTTPITDVSNGTLVINIDGTYTYTPDANFNGSDSFEYEVCDDGTPSACARATVTITVNAVNDAPVAVNDVASVDEDGVLNGTTVLGNDSDPEDDKLTINTTPVTDVANGTLVINPDGSYIYTPDADFNGDDSFEYEICDDGTPSLCTKATVNITVNSVNDAPVAVNDMASVDADQVLNGSSLLANDSDPDGDNLLINTTPLVNVSNGTLVIDTDGTYTYTPNAGYVGSDSFEYEVCDDGTPSACSRATVSITVHDVNAAPIAVDDEATTGRNETLNGSSLLANDIDPDDDNLTINTTPVLEPAYGTLTINTDGTYTYEPNADYVGTDYFEYTVCDDASSQLCSTAGVRIDIIIKDTDGDGLPDDIEGDGDCDNDGTPDWLDADKCYDELEQLDGFSPNGDGINDNYIIPWLNQFDKVSFEVFNRWGNIVYRQDKYENNWKGESNVGMSLGDELPVGTYYYIIVIKDNGQKLNGYIYLNR
ncbi:tandem-95 repeat protein [Carboxylicivirga sp. N1Y90]|uniref:tandem-95 repeat protein n=1 Tax=Carboxylicivirga fragile TaxID=3417571 RepID=UPI003D357D59|nr:tandem-95 repeat protein [Marinilabiliaceae bacterium N1Y90]